MTRFEEEEVFPKIETKRLIIRKLIREDVEFLYNYFNQEEVNRFIYVSLESIDDAYDFYERWQKDPTRFRLGIELKESQELIGTIVYLNWSKDHY
ncbi:MAG: GNAT family N-acetyltransferase, partial [Candidatus Hodarchaeales archaeon]